MITKEWKEVEGIQNVGEDDERVVAMRNYSYSTGELLDSIQVAFCAFGGLKVLEVENVIDFCPMEHVNGLVGIMGQEIGDDYELAIPVVLVDKTEALIAIDSSGDVNFVVTSEPGKGTTITPVVTQADEYDAYEMEDLDYDLLEKFDFA